MKSVAGHVIALLTYKEYVLLGQDVADNPDHHSYIPELGIDTDYTEVYGLLARMVFRFNPSIQRQATIIRARLPIPALYDGIHIRGGDKAMETCLISGQRIIQTLNPRDGSCVFVLTDDYRQYQELQSKYPRAATPDKASATDYNTPSRFDGQSSDSCRRCPLLRLNEGI